MKNLLTKMKALEILAKVEELTGLKVAFVSVEPTTPQWSITQWKVVAATMFEEDLQYNKGQKVTFHFEDKSYIHIKF